MSIQGERGFASVELTDAQIDTLCTAFLERKGEAIATAIGDIIVRRVQVEIGKSALRALAWVAGATVVAAMAAMSSHQGFWKYIFER